MMDERPEITFRSRSDMNLLAKTRQRIVVGIGGATAVIFFGTLAFDVIFEMLYSKQPITTWLSTSPYRWPALGAVFLLLWMYGKTGLWTRQRQIANAYPVVLAFNRGESAIQRGIARGSNKLVAKGVEELNGLEPFCFEMPEYNELLEKGRSWLKAHEERD